MNATTKKNWIIGGTVAVIAAYLLLSRNSEGGDGVDPTGNGTGSQSNGSFGFNAHAIATQLYEIMKTAGYASFLNPNEEAAIFAILTKVNEQQFAQVSKAFGQLAYNESTGNQVNFWFTPLPKRDLVFWLKTELGGISDEAYRTLKSKFPNFF